MTSQVELNRIDWSREWTRAYDQSSIAMRKSNKASYWEKRADRFSKLNNGAAGRIKGILDHIEIDNTTTILDIGCGPGNLAVPLAKHVRSVTALDPAKAMLHKLEDFSKNEGATNLRCINKGWLEAVEAGDIEPHDLVLSSYSLIMQDIGKALEAMNALAKRTVCLFWFAGKQCFGYDTFWPALFGEKYIPGPDHVVLLNILNAMTIYPEVSIITQQHTASYADLDDAVQCWFENLYATSDDQRDIIRRILKETLEFSLDHPRLVRDVKTAMIWWNKD